VSTAADYDARLAGLVEPLVALAPSAWGRGYASEALAELVRYAHARLGLDRLAGVTDVPNAASDRMLRGRASGCSARRPGRATRCGRTSGKPTPPAAVHRGLTERRSRQSGPQFPGESGLRVGRFAA
jgi:hypothetical protein